MIKAEDLRIGDLVKINENCSLKEGVISYITEIRTRGIFEKEDCVKVKHFDSDWEFGVRCCNINPIPLTPEILRKNEIDYLNEGVVTYNKRIHRGIILVLRPYGKVFDVIIKRNWHAKGCHIRYIEYIHELQHLLWALGRNANLKI